MQFLRTECDCCGKVDSPQHEMVLLCSLCASKYQESKSVVEEIRKQITALTLEFCELYNGDLSGEAISLLLSELRKLTK